MTNDDKELERLAKAATPGPWTQWMEHGEVWSGVPDRNTSGSMGGGGLRTRVCECDPDDYDGEDDDAAEEAAIATAAYIAAANPAAILSLLERLQVAEQARAERLANENGMLLERVRELEAHVQELERDAKDVDQQIEALNKKYGLSLKIGDPQTELKGPPGCKKGFIVRVSPEDADNVIAYFTGYAQDYAKLETRVRELEAAQAWTPVSVALPVVEASDQPTADDAVRVLTRIDGRIVAGYYGWYQSEADDDGDLRFGWHWDEDEMPRLPKGAHVTHWRALDDGSPMVPERKGTAIREAQGE